MLRSPVGSSPRVRGKPRDVTIRAAQHRLIPARAGKTRRNSSALRTLRAHPRACGENYIHRVPVSEPVGSSPRVRGKLLVGRRCQRQIGLIPARAGKTCGRPRTIRTLAAHPRACGENDPRCGRRGRGPGSSPRVRGKPHAGGDAGGDHGLIPARAGKTVRVGPTSTASAAHPRACGESIRLVFFNLRILGSSPRVRGKRWSRCRRRAILRLIPARAGKRAGPDPGRRSIGLIPARAGKTGRTTR